MALRRPDPSFVMVAAMVACLVAGLTVFLVHLALKGGAFEPSYPELGRLACKSAPPHAPPTGRPSSCG